jgi:GH15 family glucan-1,4-alpha-glucosidase
MQLTRLVDWLCHNWQQPDEGIWETRGGKREFAYSRVLSSVALDRAIRLAHKRSFPAPFDRWYRVRDDIYADIYQNFWDPKLRAFVQYKGAQTVDASCLLMPLVRFTGPTDPRWISTMKAIKQSLVEDSLVYRYNLCHASSDGLSGREGRFPCARSGLWSACRERVISKKRASFLKRRSVMPTTSVFTRKSLDRPANTWEISLKHSLT